MWRSGKNLFLAHWSICVSFAQVKSHIHTYLKNLEENLLDIEDRTELYLLFVNCFQVKTDRLSFPFSAPCITIFTWVVYICILSSCNLTEVNCFT